MKIKLLLITLLAFFSLSTKAQTSGTVSTTIGNYFVSGVYTVNNTITASEATAYWIDFYLADPTFTTMYDSLIDNTGGNTTKSWTYDMGQLDTGMVIWAIFYNSGGNFIGYNYYYPNMILTPQWILDGGTATGVAVAGNSVHMTGHLPLFALPNSMPSDVPGLAGRPYDLGQVEITFNNLVFDCNSGNTNPISNPEIAYNLNIFNQTTSPIPINYTINYTGTCFDQSFNLNFNDSTSISQQIVNIKWPGARFVPIPALPILTVKLDGRLNISADLKGKLVYGYDAFNSAYGFIGSGNDTTSITAKINADAFLRVTADAIVADVSGSVVAKGSIGGGFTYESFRMPQLNPMFGLDLKIAGEIDYRIGFPAFFGLGKTGHYSKTFYQNKWGNQIRSPFEKQIWDRVDAKGNYTRMLRSNPYLQTPEFFAQPNMTANNSDLYVVWLDYTGNNTDLLFNKLDYQSNSFSIPTTVTTAEVISNPKVAMLPSGNALISWTQNRFTHTTYDTTTMDLSDLLKGQDIWVTLYDKTTNSFATPQMLSDVNTGLTSGREEGKANIIMGKGNYGLITWVVNNDNTGTNSDVWYATVAEVGSTVSIGAPSQLINLPGTNKSINISFYDSINAVACWINDPDGLDSTLDNQVVFQNWTQTSATTGAWGAQYILIGNDGATSFDALSTDFNGNYGAVAWTSTNYSGNDVEKRITADAWDSGLGQWATQAMATSTNYTFTQPKLSVNQNGYVALTYQDIALLNDTTSPDVGRLNLYLNDSQFNPNSWTPNNSNPLLGDPAVYDWDLNTTYGNQNHFYIITQEADTTTGNAPVNPPNGVHFGNNYLNLVFRALDVSPTIITDIPEPSTQSTFTKGNHFDFNLYPNPITVYSTIEYSLDNSSNISIEIFDLMGRSVAKIFEGKQNAGTYKAIFEPKALTNGIYLCKVTANNQTAVKKMIIAK